MNDGITIFFKNEVSKNETNQGDLLDLNEVFYTFSWAPKKVNKSKNYSQKRLKSKTKKGKLPAPGRSKDCQPSSKNLGKIFDVSLRTL